MITQLTDCEDSGHEPGSNTLMLRSSASGTIAIDITKEYINSLWPSDAYTVYMLCTHFAICGVLLLFCGLVPSCVTHIIEGYSNNIDDIMRLHQMKFTEGDV